MSLPRSAILIAACMSLSVGSLVRPAVGQTTGNTIPDAVAGFLSGDRERIVTSRNALMNAITANNPTLLAAYARDVNAAILPVLASPNGHARLNAALVVQRVANASGSAALSPAITKLIQDESPAISSLGIRSAGNVLPRVFADRTLAQSDPIVPAILEAVRHHDKNESIASDAYAAIGRTLLDSKAALTALGDKGFDQAIPRAVDAAHAVMAIRLPRFGAGTIPEPAAEQDGINLAFRNWGKLTPPQQATALTDCSLLLTAIGKEMVATKDPQSAGRPRFQALRNGILVTVASGLAVISEQSGKGSQLKPSLDAIKGVPVGQPPITYIGVIDNIVGALAIAYPEAKLPTTQPATTTPVQ